MQNFSHGQQNDADKARQINMLQREIMMQEIDRKKKENEKLKLESESRGLKNDEAHIKVSLQEKQTRIIKLDSDLRFLDEALKEMKKKLNALL